ncbi:MAG: GLUG motif-containing protein [Planctomycetota bacterium]|jgi:hypothetical protein
MRRSSGPSGGSVHHKQSGKLTIPSVVFLVICFLGRPIEAQYGGGTGEPNDPYQIAAAEDLILLGESSEDYDKHFILTADIDLNPNLRGHKIFDKAIVDSFTGVFDGNGHAISHLTIAGTGRLGLFGGLGSVGEISNLGLEEVDINGTGNFVAGLVGSNHGTIINCYTSGSVSGNWIVAGLTAYNTQDGTITNSSSTANVSGELSVGGLVGQNDNLITNCYATGSIVGSGRVGGLVGMIFGPPQGFGITNCYSTGSVSGDNLVGGLVGYGGFTTVKDSFWDVQTSGLSTSSGGTGKATTQMQNVNTFLASGWDFVGELQNGPNDDWAMPAGGGYPILSWQLSESQLPPLPGFSGGTGELDDPYLISTPQELNQIGHNPRLMERHFKLIDHIDMTEVDFFIIGSSLFPFAGVFDGNGMSISNFRCVSTNTDNIGLFGYVDGENARINDLGLIDPNVSGWNYVGSLVGHLEKGTINDCYSEGGSVTGNYYVGGLVGTGSGTVSGCHSSSSVSGGGTVGGLVGQNDSLITNCYLSGNVSGNRRVGGLVGQNVPPGSITNCYSAGNVSGDRGVGSLAGSNSVYAKIMYCYSTGGVSGNEDVGGLVGFNAGTIAGCYSVGGITGNEKVGGLVGDNTVGVVLASYSLGTASGTANVGGLIGIGGGAYNSYWDIQTSRLSSSSGGAGRTTAEMQMASTLVGWGHDPIWTIDEGKDYPRLWWENIPGETVTTASPFEIVTGTGTESDPYLIYTAEELNMVGQFPYAWDKHFKLMADIDLGGYTGEAFNIIGRYSWPFTGVFDGNDKIISRFSYTSPLAHSVGLFRSVKGESAQIKDLGLVDPNIDAGTGSAVGALVGGLSRGGAVSNCYAEGGSVRGSDYVGGLVGENWGMITGCYATGSVSGEDWGIGGLAGINPGSITNCHASGSVSGTRNVGGLTGNSADAITNSYATGTVSGSDFVGGLVGRSWGSITDSYATGGVSGSTDIGGLAGRSTHTITYCYSTGSVAGTSDFGGLVGAGNGTVIFSFWDTQTSGQPASDGGTPKTTAEMQTASTFLEAGWDFVDEMANGTEDIWWILEGQDYPRLWWELIDDGSPAPAEN